METSFLILPSSNRKTPWPFHNYQMEQTYGSSRRRPLIPKSDLYEEVIRLLALGKYDAVHAHLKANSTQDSKVHDLVAALAVKYNDRRAFEMTDHHTRVLLTDFSPDEELFPRLIQWYFEADYLDNYDVPDYIWEACSFENAKYLQFFTGESPDDYVLEEKDQAWKDYFDYEPPPNGGEESVYDHVPAEDSKGNPLAPEVDPELERIRHQVAMMNAEAAQAAQRGVQYPPSSNLPQLPSIQGIYQPPTTNPVNNPPPRSVLIDSRGNSHPLEPPKPVLMATPQTANPQLPGIGLAALMARGQMYAYPGTSGVDALQMGALMSRPLPAINPPPTILPMGTITQPTFPMPTLQPGPIPIGPPGMPSRDPREGIPLPGYPSPFPDPTAARKKNIRGFLEYLRVRTQETLRQGGTLKGLPQRILASWKELPFDQKQYYIDRVNYGGDHGL